MTSAGHQNFGHDPDISTNLGHSYESKILMALVATALAAIIKCSNTPTSLDSETPQQQPSQQQTAPQQLPADSSALDSVVRDSNIILIPGAEGDSVEAIIGSMDGASVAKILSDSLAYNQFLRIYQK